MDVGGTYFGEFFPLFESRVDALNKVVSHPERHKLVEVEGGDGGAVRDGLSDGRLAGARSAEEDG